MNAVETQMKPRHIPIRQDWLARRVEAAIEPEMPIIDAHHHLWDSSDGRFGLKEMNDEIASGHNVVATVFVEARRNYFTDGEPEYRSVGETGMAAEMARESLQLSNGRIQVAAGIVGYVDLRLGRPAGDVLDRHIEAGNGRFRGVRNTSAWHEDPEARGSIVVPPRGLLQDPDFRAGLAELTRRGLVFDAWMYHPQLDELVGLARAFPDTSIVLNHQGGPIGIGPYAGKRAEVFDVWSQAMGRLAGCSNITVKLGGLGMLMAGFDFQDHPLPPSSDELAQAWGPYLRTGIEQFGADRCMFESNFPVDKGTACYAVIWNAFKKISHGYSAQERAQLFCGTAARVYNLAIPIDAELDKRNGHG